MKKEFSKIQWTDMTWNPAIGCDKVSAGCKYCYMMRDMGGRWKKDVIGKVTRTKPSTFNAPLQWQDKGMKAADGTRLKVFTSSLTDIFHESIDPYRVEIWDIIRKCPDLIFQILTKRPERIKDHLPEDWGLGYENVWIGVSVENQEMANLRLPILSHVVCKTKFISFEPLIEWTTLMMNPLRYHFYDIYYSEWGKDAQMENGAGIDWAIIGGESGNDTGKWRYRDCEIEWIDHIMHELEELEIPIFVKQLGTSLAKKVKKDYNVDIGKTGEKLECLPEQLKRFNTRELPEFNYESLGTI